MLFGRDGAVVATATETYGVRFPSPGWAEQNFGDWTTALEQVLAKLGAAAAGEVTHIAIAAQVDGVVALDASFAPLAPAIIWMDRRAAAEAAAVGTALGNDRVYSTTGLNCDGSHGAPKMRWLLDRFAIAPQYLLPPGPAINLWLTGVAVQDHANASSSMLYDIKARAWSSEMVKQFQIPDLYLGEIVDSTAIIGTIRPEIAKRVGLSQDCQVVAGTGDDHGSALGVGAAVPGIVADISGTAEPVGTTTPDPVLDPLQLVEAHAHAAPDLYFIENPGFVSGGSVMWLAGILGTGQSDLFLLADESPPGAGGLGFVPALSGSMTPRWNDLARGSFTGMSMDHGRAEMARAVLEGCVFGLRDIVDRLKQMQLPVTAVHVGGGGARSDLWLQMKADILGIPVRPVRGEACATGAGCLAGVAAGWFTTVDEATDAMVTVGAVFEPAAAHQAEYAEAYDRYRRVFDALEPTWGYE